MLTASTDGYQRHCQYFGHGQLRHQYLHPDLYCRGQRLDHRHQSPRPSNLRGLRLGGDGGAEHRLSLRELERRLDGQSGTDTNVTANISVTANFDSINNTLLTLAYPAGGTYAAVQVSLMAVGIPATAIYFTTDGSDPTTSSTPYAAPISIPGTGTTTLKFFSMAGTTPEPIKTEVYTIDTSLGGTVEPPPPLLWPESPFWLP